MTVRIYQTGRDWTTLRQPRRWQDGTYVREPDETRSPWFWVAGLFVVTPLMAAVVGWVL